VDENGDDVHELITITTRATEYLTPESMPGKLPPTSAYTYCVELSVDGAKRVRFEKPVIVWVDNFLGFDVGATAPVGFYDRDRGVWVPEKNGQVVKLLDTDADGIFDALDADGDDMPDDLDQNGSFGNEVKGLDDAQKFQPGTTYWRIALDHFTPIDINWARRIIRRLTPLTPHLPQNSISPNPNGEPYTEVQKTEEPITLPEDDLCLNSYVKQRSRVFHEDIKIPQTDVTLHYASNRVDDYRHGITIPASGEMIPEGLKKIIVQVNIAGKSYKVELPAEPNQIAEFEWDGLDHLGRRVQYNTTAQAEIGFVYDAVYTVPPVLEKAFGMTGTDLTSVLSREQIILWKRNDIEIPLPSIKGQGTIADGWTVSLQHNLDIKDPTILHKGDGTVLAHLVTIIDRIVGNETSGYSGDGGPATEAQLYYPSGVAVASTGDLYIADSHNYRIRKVDVNGIITTIAGNGTRGYSGDGGPATEAQFYDPISVIIDSDGIIYIADRGEDYEDVYPMV
jgi:hypothetical protein